MATAASIAAGLSLQKYWHSSLYAQASRAIAIYSQRLSKPLAEWAAQDAAHANILQQASYALAKKDGATDLYCAVPTSAVPVTVPPIRAPKPDEAEDGAIAILTAVAASEYHNAALIADTAQNPQSKALFQILDLDMLAQTSSDREQICLEMIAMIKENRLWESDSPVKWRCLQCGARSHGRTAFEVCDCCNASRAFATCATF